ncbi:hypothetical protein CA850_16495 [Micromonospora echinospora]|uniref:Uncharacterized protein n=1 Tax=Micromonospora echinospora TaxID=1877 RepID=A0A1C4WRQ0_MICEC|nr:hypothetical protein [Micromonospora echinospora]OZV79669.1 hypothetical protein CA850_16495 [Micromonospora echinospora]SCE98838.1 hypothetical protein GA0070618_2437 [Micromonospora echinospora]
MSDSHPPYGGPSDPNAGQPWGPPPGQPVSGQPWGPPPGQPISGQPDPYGGYGQPGYQQQPGYAPPQYAAPVQPPKKNRGLMIGLGVGAATVALLALCGVGVGVIVANGDDDDPTPPPIATSSAPGGDTNPSTAPSPSESQDDVPNNNNAVTARYSSDFDAVCAGNPVLNAAAYSAPAGSKAYTFYNSPTRLESWSLRSTGYGKSYYAKSDEFEKVSVVGCLKYQDGSEGEGRKCQLKDSDDKIITVDYVSSRYTLTFYAAKTAQKIGDGGTINAPAVRCPSFVTYNKATMKAYASPDSGAIEAAMDKFLG